MSRLIGANRSYIDERLPHIGELLIDSVDAVVEHGEVLIVASRAPEIVDALGQAGDDRLIVDLACGCPTPGSYGTPRTTRASAGNRVRHQRRPDPMTSADLDAPEGGLSGVLKRGVGYSAVGVAICQIVVVVQTIVLAGSSGPPRWASTRPGPC